MSIIPRIVLVDDIRTNLKIFRHALSGEKYSYFSYTDSEDALANIEMVQPHLLILDIEMPKLDGIELLEKKRVKMGNRNIPVIFITTLDNEERLRHAYELGANDILPKDFEPYQLKLRLKLY
jgi:CheY-like chemotaxis protein